MSFFDQQADQRLLESQLFSAHNIEVEFRTLRDLHAESIVDSNGSGALTLQDLTTGGPSRRVSVVYYRAGYAPTDYPSEIEVL